MTDVPAGGYAPPDLLSAQRLGWIVSAEPELHATLLPLRVDVGAAGDAEAILGHFAKSNPHVAALRHSPAAVILVLGPHGYISPSWLSDRTQAPTWNYAAARFDVRFEFIETEDFTRRLLREQVDAEERGRPGAWSIDEMGDRFERLARHVVGFEARVQRTTPMCKLGERDRDDVLVESLRALAGDPLAAWMVAANPGRV